MKYQWEKHKVISIEKYKPKVTPTEKELVNTVSNDIITKIYSIVSGSTLEELFFEKDEKKNETNYKELR
jgi:hypothetical protein